MVQTDASLDIKKENSSLLPPTLLVDIGPTKITVGHTGGALESLSYQTFMPNSFKTLQDVVESYLNAQSFEDQGLTFQKSSFVVAVACPEEIETGSISYPLKAEKEAFISYLGPQKSLWISRKNAIAKAIPYLTGQDFASVSQDTPIFSEPKDSLVYVDLSFDLKGVPLLKEAQKGPKVEWTPLENSADSLRMQTGIEAYLQLIRYIQTTFASSEHPFRVGQFFSQEGLEKTFTSLFNLKDIKESVLDRLQRTSKVVSPGAPVDLDPAEMNRPPHMGLEGIEIRLSPNALPRKNKIFKESTDTQETLEHQEHDFNWVKLSTLSVSIIIAKAIEAYHMKAPLGLLAKIQDMPSEFPPEVLQCCQEALVSWGALLGEFLARFALMYEAKGGAYIGGEILELLANILPSLPIEKSFYKEGEGDVNFQKIPLRRIIHPIPSFVGLLRYLWEEN